MNRLHKKRIATILCIFVLVSLAASLILYALKQNINLFFTPTELLAAKIHPEQIFRVGGYVKKNSVHFNSSGESVDFTVTDRKNEIHVMFQGVLPSLFREGQVVVITGKLNQQHDFIANQVLAKHDEKYMPRALSKDLVRAHS